MIVEAIRPVVLGCAIAALLVLPLRASIERVDGPVDTGFDPPHRVEGTWLGIEGRDRTCALRSDASVWCWDVNAAQSPELVARFPGATMFANGSHDYHCALVAGRVWCRGGTIMIKVKDIGRAMPTRVVDVPIALPKPAVAITGGSFAVCARGVSGTVYCWGSSRDGGPWNVRHRSGSAIEDDPLVGDFPPAQAFALFGDLDCAIVDGKASCSDKSTASAHAISVGLDQHCFATDDDIRCDLELPASLIDDNLRLTTTHHAGRATALAGTERTSCAVIDHRVSCWHGTAPAHDLGLTDIVAISVGDSEACALDSFGALYCTSWTR